MTAISKGEKADPDGSREGENQIPVDPIGSRDPTGFIGIQRDSLGSNGVHRDPGISGSAFSPLLKYETRNNCYCQNLAYATFYKRLLPRCLCGGVRISTLILQHSLSLRVTQKRRFFFHLLGVFKYTRRPKLLICLISCQRKPITHIKIAI